MMIEGKEEMEKRKPLLRQQLHTRMILMVMAMIIVAVKAVIMIRKTKRISLGGEFIGLRRRLHRLKLISFRKLSIFPVPALFQGAENRLKHVRSANTN